jgi:hypothetical protein
LQGFRDAAGFGISFASARNFPPPDLLPPSRLFSAASFRSCPRGLGQYFQEKITCVRCSYAPKTIKLLMNIGVSPSERKPIATVTVGSVAISVTHAARLLPNDRRLICSSRSTSIRGGTA